MIRIAIDGPGGAGKSTIAKAVANKLGIDYIDTGAMYRAVAYKMTKLGITAEDAADVEKMLESTDIDFSSGDTILDGEIINSLIRSPEISAAASACSAIPAVRSKLVDLQRKMGSSKSVIMDGRDIGTNVLKDAEYKFFLTASAEERAKRRYEELNAKGISADFITVFRDIESRDRNDMTRAIDPLMKAEDAEEIDSTRMSIEEVIDHIISKIDRREI